MYYSEYFFNINLFAIIIIISEYIDMKIMFLTSVLYHSLFIFSESTAAIGAKNDTVLSENRFR